MKNKKNIIVAVVYGVMIAMLISGIMMLKNYEKYDTVDHPETSVVEKELVCDFDEDAVI